jgi:hypothetical protein
VRQPFTSQAGSGGAGAKIMVWCWAMLRDGSVWDPHPRAGTARALD